MYLLSMAEITSGSSFEPNKLREQKLGYVRLRVVESENDLEKKISPNELIKHPLVSIFSNILTTHAHNKLLCPLRNVNYIKPVF